MNSTGAPSLMGFVGTTSVSRDDLAITAGPVPTGQFGLFIQGELSGNAPLPGGGGAVCITFPVYRLPIVQSQGGLMSYQLQLQNTVPGVAPITGGRPGGPGWHRDSVGAGFLTLERPQAVHSLSPPGPGLPTPRPRAGRAVPPADRAMAGRAVSGAPTADKLFGRSRCPPGSVSIRVRARDTGPRGLSGAPPRRGGTFVATAFPMTTAADSPPPCRRRCSPAPRWWQRRATPPRAWFRRPRTARAAPGERSGAAPARPREHRLRGRRLRTLPDAPGNYPGIQNVFRLSDRIISGSEPHDAEALAQLAAWGVRTVISVDGKAPDLEGAAAAGLSTHVPVRYGGITEDQVMQIAKSFRELEAPFYVLLRPPPRSAAAAIGRVALDDLGQDVAIAEMRQWCSTAAKYEGLYSTVATATIPSPNRPPPTTSTSPPRHASGLREGMIAMTRVWDEVKLVEANGWLPDEEHPDIDPLPRRRSSPRCSALRRRRAPDGAGEDFEEMMGACLDGADRLVELLTDCSVEGVALDDRLEVAFDVVSESCLDCHVDYQPPR